MAFVQHRLYEPGGVTMGEMAELDGDLIELNYCSHCGKSPCKCMENNPQTNFDNRRKDKKMRGSYSKEKDGWCIKIYSG